MVSNRQLLADPPNANSGLRKAQDQEGEGDGFGTAIPVTLPSEGR
jgi:hypothetical protein